MKNSITKEEIERINSTVSILEMAESISTEPPRRVGSEYVTYCTFHADGDTPNLSINTEKNSFYCHSCKEGGDAIKFAMQAFGTDFKATCIRLGAKASQYSSGLSPEQIRRRKEQRRQAESTARNQSLAASRLSVILKSYQWNISDVYDESPVRIDDATDNPEAFIECMFGQFQNYALWNASEHYHVGSGNFKSPDQWLKDGVAGALISTGLFPNDGGSGRGGDRVILWPYIVIECDEFTPDGSGGYRKPRNQSEKIVNLSNGLALVNFLRRNGLDLEAIVYSGNKSYHSYFKTPGESEMKFLENVYQSLCIDGSFRIKSQPWRIPGFKHHKPFDRDLLSSRLVYMKGGWA